MEYVYGIAVFCFVTVIRMAIYIAVYKNEKYQRLENAIAFAVSYSVWDSLIHAPIYQYAILSVCVNAIADVIDPDPTIFDRKFFGSLFLIHFISAFTYAVCFAEYN